MRVALDLDGVITNFTKQSCKALGEIYPATEELADYGWLFNKYGDATCYKKLKGHLFWVTMEKFPWADKLIDIVNEETKGNWIFLTKPMVDPYCYSGKAEWIMHHYRKYLNKLTIIGADKANFVRSNKDVIIDDHPKNVANWAAAGGTPIKWVEIGDQFDSAQVETRLENIRTQLQIINNS